jgi:hypothetical protein
VVVSPRRNIGADRTCFTIAYDEVITDLAQALGTVIELLIPDVFHDTDQSVNNRVECDHGRLARGGLLERCI